MSTWTIRTPLDDAINAVLDLIMVCESWANLPEDERGATIAALEASDKWSRAAVVLRLASVVGACAPALGFEVFRPWMPKGAPGGVPRCFRPLRRAKKGGSK